MSIQKSLSVSIMGLVFVAIVSIFAMTLLASAQEAPADEEVTPVTTQEESAETTESYNYVAQPSDSYTKMARKAVQTYGFEAQTELSGAQIVFIETNLTLLADSPELILGEEVSIVKQSVTDWVEKAKGLSDAQKAAWQVYADEVDFNTDNVGEVQE